MKTAWRILAVSERVHCAQEDLGFFVIAWHDDDDFWCSVFVKDILDASRATNIVGDKLVDAKKPWHGQQSCKGPKCEPNGCQFCAHNIIA